MIVIGVLAGLVVVVASAQLGLLRSPTPIPIAVAASATPSPTQTAIPSRTITPSAADQVRAFAAPILAAIANKPPNFQDDFSNQSGGWKVFPQDQPGYVDGEFSIVAPPAATGSVSCYGTRGGIMPSPGFESSDLVLEIDGRADLGSQADWIVKFRLGQNGGYDVAIDPNGYLSLRRPQQNVDLLPGGYRGHRPADGNHVQIIAKGARIAISANGEPIALVIDPQPLQEGLVALMVCNNSSTQAEARFDNLKIWDISDLPSPP